MVLLAMSRESLLDEHIDGLQAAGGTIDAFSPNSVALYNAFVRHGVVQDDTVLIASIGAESTDVVITRGADLLFARNLSGGSKLPDDALAQRLGMGAAEAESVKIDHVDLTPGARHRNPEGESHALRPRRGGADHVAPPEHRDVLQEPGEAVGTQARPRPGLRRRRGGPGPPEYLSAGMGVPVERFDAFRVVDTSGLSPEEADLLSENEWLGRRSRARDDGVGRRCVRPRAPAGGRREEARLHGGHDLAHRSGGARARVPRIQGLGQVREARRHREAREELRERGGAAERVHEQTKDLVEQNEILSSRVTELAAVAGAGEQVARVFDALDDHLPRDFWVTRVTSEVAVDEDLGIERGAEKPLLTVNGSARPGTQSPTSQFQTFAAALEEDLEGWP